jgi:hypothetical protein
MLCWICGADANTREHKGKASDLRSVFGTPTQAMPLYLHTDVRRNRPVGSLKSDALKFQNKICQDCNSARTQPHDRAWERCSTFVRSHLAASTGSQVIRCNRIFPYDTSSQMLNLHLYFVKLFGCHIVEADISIDIQPFAAAILRNVAHSRIYLGFVRIDDTPVSMVGASDAVVAFLDGKAAFSTWLYEVAGFAVRVMYAIEGERRQGLVNSWHPRFGCKRLHIEPIKTE